MSHSHEQKRKKEEAREEAMHHMKHNVVGDKAKAAEEMMRREAPMGGMNDMGEMK